VRYAAALAAVFAAGQAAAAEELGRKVFTEIAQPSCALCHTLQAAGATGTLGPSLDELKPDKAKALQALQQGVGVMPSYADKLTRQQVEAVAEYVAKTAGAGK
jgi:mono/diheme cytochrome c family protein